MRRCSFEKLVNLLDKELDLDGQIEVLDHIDRCGICHEAVYSIIRDRDSGMYDYGPYAGEMTHAGRQAGI